MARMGHQTEMREQEANEATLGRLLESLRLLSGASVDCASVSVDGDAFELQGLRIANLPPANLRGRLSTAVAEIDLTPLFGIRAKRTAASFRLAHLGGVIDERGPIELHFGQDRACASKSFAIAIEGKGRAQLAASWHYGPLDGSFRLAHSSAGPLALLWRLGEAALEMVLLGGSLSGQDWLKLLDTIAAPAAQTDRSED